MDLAAGTWGGAATDGRVTFTFDTTHHALWAEAVANETRIPVEVVPAPSGAHAKCDLALETLPVEVPRLSELLRTAGVPHAIYREPG